MWIFFYFWRRILSPPVAIEVKFCTAKRTHMPVGPAKFGVNRCNEAKNLIFWPVSKFNTGCLPLRGILPVASCRREVATICPHPGLQVLSYSVTCEANHMKFETLM